MAKAKAEKTEKAEKAVNGTLTFEKLGKDFEIPKRVRTSMYDPFLEELSKTSEVVCAYRSGPEPRAANARRKALLDAAAKKGITITATVRKIDGDNVLLVQMGQ